MPINKTKNQGFTLLEMAVVLGILTVLLSMLITPMSAQRQTASLLKVRAELADIEEALYGYAITHGALPCPTFAGLGGQALDASATNCERGGTEEFHGFVPATTLGLKGQVDCYGLLLDPWGQPYRYSVSSSNLSADAEVDFVRPGEIRAEAQLASNGLADVQANIRICGDGAQCCSNVTPVSTLVADNVAAVVFSLGRHNQNLSVTENENAGETNESVSGACSAATLGLAADRFFYHVPTNEQMGSEFDDEFVWISPSILFAKMLAAGQLP